MSDLYLSEEIIKKAQKMGYVAHETISMRKSRIFETLEEAVNYAKRVYAPDVPSDDVCFPYASIYEVYCMSMETMKSLLKSIAYHVYCKNRYVYACIIGGGITTIGFPGGYVRSDGEVVIIEKPVCSL